MFSLGAPGLEEVYLRRFDITTKKNWKQLNNTA